MARRTAREDGPVATAQDVIEEGDWTSVSAGIERATPDEARDELARGEDGIDEPDPIEEPADGKDGATIERFARRGDKNRQAKPTTRRRSARPAQERPAREEREQPDDTPDDDEQPEPEARGTERGDREAQPEGRRRRDKTLEGRVEEKKQLVGRLTKEENEKRRAIADLDRQIEERKKQVATPPAAKVERKPAPKWADYDAKGKAFDEFNADWQAWFIEDFKASNPTATKDEVTEAKREMQSTLQTERERDQKRQRLESYARRADATRARIKDWKEKIDENLDGLQTTPFFDSLIYDHPNGPEVLYNLAGDREAVEIILEMDWSYPMRDALEDMQNPEVLLLHFVDHEDEHERILAMRPAAALLALGKLASRLEGANGSPRSARRPTASRPIRPVPESRVTGDRAGGGGDDGDDIESFIRDENAADLKRGRRF